MFSKNTGQRNTNRAKNYISLAFLFILMAITACASTPAIPTPNGIASLEEVTLGGLAQWVLIRGEDTTKPILLYLHGGPGTPAIPFEHALRALEKDFIVVMWDQRGAGKSYSPDIPRESMTLDQLVSDALELVQGLLVRFRQEKLYLVGHSCGSIIGVRAVQMRPELFYAYVGIGQVVGMAENERVSYEYMITRAHETDNRSALTALAKITPPYQGKIDDLMMAREWIVKLGGVVFGETNYDKLIRVAMASPEYTLGDLLKIEPGSRFSNECLWEDLLAVDFFTQVPRLEVPVYFFTGRHDYITPWNLTVKYFAALDAPQGKQLIWFENSAHIIILEEPEKFIQTMVDTVVAETRPRQGSFE